MSGLHGTHPNTQKNLLLPKHRKEGFGYYRDLPQELIDRLFMRVADDGMSLKAAAKDVGIAFETAKKYFEQGDKKRGIKPLRKRLFVYREKVTETFDKELLKRRKVLIKLVQKVISKLEEQVNSGVIFSKASLTQLDRLVRLEIHLSGQTQSREQEIITAEDLRSLEQSETSDKENG